MNERCIEVSAVDVQYVSDGRDVNYCELRYLATEKRWASLGGDFSPI